MPVWSEQDTMISDSAAAFFRDVGEVSRVRNDASNVSGKRFFQRAAEQGWIGMLVSQAHGGAGLGLRDALVLMRAAGRHLPPEPLAAAIALAQAMQHVPELSNVLARTVVGEQITLPAFCDAKDPNLEIPLWTRPVAGLNLADALVVINEPNELIFVPEGSFSRDTRRSLDRGFVGIAEVQGSKRLRAGRDLCDSLIDTWLMLHAAELVGLGHEALSRTVNYLEARTQFGVPLSSFQALQHSAANVYVQLAAADALVFEAARAFDTADQSFAALASFRCAAAAADKAAKEAIQMHGAIGFTDECEIGLFLKRAVAISTSCRDLARHRVPSHQIN
jgi:alkylation response protein AidB-like acyl-CoA dehydrogenase